MHVQSFLNTMGGSVHSISRNPLRPYPADSSSPRCCSLECVVNRYLLVITILVHSCQPCRMRKSSVRSYRDVAQQLQNLRPLKPYGHPCKRIVNIQRAGPTRLSERTNVSCLLCPVSCLRWEASWFSPVWHVNSTRAIEKRVGSTHSEERIEPDQYTRRSQCVANRSSYFHFVHFVVDVDEH